MEFTQIYATAVGGVFLLLLSVRGVSSVQRVLRALDILVAKHLTYPLIVRRHRLLGPWSRADVLVQVIYLTVNVFCMTFRVTAVEEIGVRAGALAISNMAPLFFGFHLSFLADILRISLSTYRRIHRMAGWMSCQLVLVEALVAIHGDSSFLRDMPKNLYMVIGGASLILLTSLSLPFLRRLTYELFLRSHQALAFVCAYALWRRPDSKTLPVRIHLYVSAGILGLTTFLQFCSILYRNVSFQRGLPRARMIRMNGGIKVMLIVPSRLRIKPEQYVNLWIPSISFWAFSQSHPFVVASYTEGEQTTLELLIGPQRGLTSKLLRDNTNVSTSVSSDLRLALFSGPHGLSVPVAEFESVFLVASGLGIVAQLPYLRYLIRGYNDFQVRTRRIHLAWQLESLEDGALVQDVLNQALQEDTLDNGYILSVSVYHILGEAKSGFLSEGRHRRVSIYHGRMDLADLLRGEVTGARSPARSDGKQERSYYEKARIEEEMVDTDLSISTETAGKKGGRILVTVSASGSIRDELRELVIGYLDDRVSLLELEYQPHR